MTFIRQSLATIVVCLLLASCFMGCSGIPGVSPYDAWTDKQVTTINGKVQKFFIKMAGSDDEHKKYKHHKAGYEEILIDLEALLTRTYARQDTEMMPPVRKCIVYWKQAILVHKAGGSDSPEASQLAKLIAAEKVEEAYKVSKRFHTDADPKQMDAKYPDAERQVDADTLLQALRLLMRVEMAKQTR